MTVSAPWRRAAALMAAMSATSPVADWTAEYTTTSTPGSMDAANSASGTDRTRTPRSACTANGKTSEVNSMSAVSTVAPSGTATATGANSWDTVAPVATRAGSAPTNPANRSRDSCTESAHGSQLVRP